MPYGRAKGSIIAPVSYESREPPKWGPQVPIFIEKLGPGSLFHNILGTGFRGPPVQYTCGHAHDSACMLAQLSSSSSKL